MSLSTRIPTAIVLICIAILGIVQGGGLFFTGIVVICVLCLHEILKMKNLYINPFFTIFLYFVLSIFLFLALMPYINLFFWNSSLLCITSLCIVALSLYETINKKIITPKNNYIQGLITVLKIGLSLPYFILIRMYAGIPLTLLLIVIVATVDSASYFSGKFLGKRKLNSISPNKTIEGTIGGITTTLVSATCIIFLLDLSIIPYLILTVLIIILAIYGDLHESLQKRKSNIKNSSSILPGHGGIYDRLDSYILALPVTFYYYVHFL